jgi:hypothetical protein
MGFVTEQQEEFRSKIDADSAAYDPNYLIAAESGQESGGEAPAPEPETAQADAPVEPDPSGAPEGYEAGQ